MFRAVAVFFLTSLLPLTAMAEFLVKDAWVREGPPKSRVLAGFMVFENHTNQALTIKNIQSDQFERVEIHQTTITDGMMKMSQIPELEIGVHKRVELAPSGKHLMLIAPKQSLRENDSVNLVLEFANGSSQAFAVPVKKDNTPSNSHSHSHSHSH